MAAAAAAAAAVHPSPSPPPPPARRTVAWLVCTHLAWATIDAVFCLFLTSMWLLFWGVATKEIGRLACGQGCAVVTAGFKVFSAAIRANLVLFVPVLLLVLMMARFPRTKAAAATDIEATQEPAPETSAGRDRLRDSLVLGFLASTAFALLVPIGDLVKGDSPVMGSRRERMGSVIYDVGKLGNAMVNCFVSCPIVTVGICRTWRMARAWGKARQAL